MTLYPHWLDTKGVCTGCGQIEPEEGSDCPYSKQRPDATDLGMSWARGNVGGLPMTEKGPQ